MEQLQQIKRAAAQVYLDYCTALSMPDYTYIAGDKELWVDGGQIHVIETIEAYLSKYTEIKDYRRAGYIAIEHKTIPMPQI